jgi:hypothetical protein
MLSASEQGLAAPKYSCSLECLAYESLRPVKCPGQLLAPTIDYTEATMSIIRLDHFNIRAPRRIIDDVIGFYRGILDLTPGSRPEFGIEGDWLYSGDHPIVHLTVDETAVAPAKNEHLNHIAFRCKGLDMYLKRLNAANIAFTDAYIPDLDITQLFVFDPAGIQIELNFLHEKLE